MVGQSVGDLGHGEFAEAAQVGSRDERDVFLMQRTIVRCAGCCMAHDSFSKEQGASDGRNSHPEDRQRASFRVPTYERASAF